MITTCGIFVMDPDNKFLLGHPTNNPDYIWSIPKGIPNEGESKVFAAFREFEEETGINLANIEWDGGFFPVGNFIYPSGKKQLSAYFVKIKQLIGVQVMKCTSMVPKEIYGQEVPEIDRFMWATKSEVMSLAHPTQLDAIWKIYSEILTKW